MTMMTCPKCGFEQPQDQFCAKCGVNVASYKPTIGIGSGLSYILKPIIFVVVIIALIFLLFKSVENEIKVPEIPVERSTQIGSGAASLKVNRPKPPPKAQVQPTTAKLKTPTEAASPVPAEEKTAEAPAETFDNVSASFSLAEHGVEEAAGKNWFLVPQPMPITASTSEHMTLKKGNNTFVFEDPLIVYDLNFFVEEITEKDVQLRLNIKRTLKARTADGSQSHTFSLNEKIPNDQTLVIIDALPRRASIGSPNSILSTLYKSEPFLSRSTELVQMIKFENPSNSPQEELTP